MRQRVRPVPPIRSRKTAVLQRALFARRITTPPWAAPASRTARAMLLRTVLFLLAVEVVNAHQSRRVKMELFQMGLFHIRILQIVNGSLAAMM